jgi:hypothetical protein
MSGVVTASLLPERGVRRRHDESQLQRAVHQFLTAALPASAVHFAVPNGLMRSKIARARAQGEAVRAGVPDLCVIASGRPIFIELKSAKGVVSAAQRETQRRLIYAGADVCLCRSVEQVEASLLEIGVPLRGRLS